MDSFKGLISRFGGFIQPVNGPINCFRLVTLFSIILIRSAALANSITFPGSGFLDKAKDTITFNDQLLIIIDSYKNIQQDASDVLVYSVNANSGETDICFGKKGVVTLSGHGILSSAQSALLVDDRLFVRVFTRKKEGSPQGSTYIYALYATDGSLDDSFGDMGQMILPDSEDSPEARELIFISNRLEGALFYNGNIQVFAINIQGALDNSFGDNGIVTLKSQSHSYTVSSILPFDGHLLILVTAHEDQKMSGGNVKLFALNAVTGGFNASFGNNGSVTFTGHGYLNRAQHMTIMNKEILVTMDSDRTNPIVVDNDYYIPIDDIMEYTSKLNINSDIDFGSGAPLDKTNDMYSSEVQSITAYKDRFYIRVNNHEPVLYALNSDGTVDYNFGQDWIGGNIVFEEAYGYSDETSALDIRNDRILLSINRLKGYNAGNVQIRALTSRGRVESTFGINGTVNLPDKGFSAAVRSVIVNNQQILVTVTTYKNPGLTDADVQLFALNIDGSEDKYWNAHSVTDNPQFYDYPYECMPRTKPSPDSNNKNEFTLPLSVTGGVVFTAAAFITTTITTYLCYRRYKRQGYQSVN